MKPDYDLIVIGAGSAGLVAARFARQLGLSVALVERSRVGGDCTWTGCVPSKALLRAAGVAQSGRSADRFGIPPSSLEVNLRLVMERIRTVIQQIYEAESPAALAREGIDVIYGEASFIGPRAISVAGENYTARRFLVCTGASPIVPGIPGLEEVDYLTYESVWQVEELPPSLAVIGGGAVGCELAQAFARLGSQVTLIEAANRILPAEDPEVSDVVSRQFVREGMRVLTGASASRIESGAEGGTVCVELHGGGKVEADALLVAVGRRPNVESLDLATAGVIADAAGIRTNRHLRTANRRVYAAGDVTGGPQFTHYAGWQGFMAVRNAFLPSNTVAIREQVPRAVFTDPEAAQSGLTEAEARATHGGRTLVSRWPMSEVDRALTDGEAEGFLKVMHLPNGRVLGATIVAPTAGELIQEWTLAIDRGVSLGDMARSIHVYPTYSMASQQLALQAYSERLFRGRVGRLLRWLARRSG